MTAPKLRQRSLYWLGRTLNFKVGFIVIIREFALSDNSNVLVGANLEDDLTLQVMCAAQTAEDSLGSETDVFFVGEILGITDWFVVTTGNNARQVRSIVDKVEEALTVGHQLKPVRVEGKENSEWVLMDYGPFIVHIFNDEAREFYNLSNLWSDVPRLEV